MENRKLRKEPVRDDEAPVQLKGRDFEPLLTTDPKKDDPPRAYDCKVPHSDSVPEPRKKRD